MSQDSFYVFCLDEAPKGHSHQGCRYVRATSRTFPNRGAADAYARTIADARRPVVTTTAEPEILCIVMRQIPEYNQVDLEDVFKTRQGAEDFIKNVVATEHFWIEERIAR